MPEPGKVRVRELEEFLTRCKRSGFDASEFVVSAHESIPERGAYPERVVAVHRKQYGRDFRTLTDAGWVEDATEALRAGHFGRP